MMFGLGKSRSKFGRWIDERGITQQEISDASGVNRNTISQLANDKTAAPSWKTKRSLIRTLRKYDSEINAEDFWG
ncbi:helix-turn-helix transcriptional regulator [Alicyclobacillus fastidiosus]|nr:helix-turn-helix domain-containing protein [Alicyclobacillus fastidiosus]WEH08164.1 helix-turn-helix domain-containing protein [Alicyclobacillus fastidiosus]